MTARSQKIRVMLVDDHHLVRAGIRSVLALETDLDVVAEAGSIAEAEAALPSAAPDVVVLDLSLPDASGVAGLGRIRTAAPGAKVIILSMHDDPEYARQAVRAGASGYLLKDDAGTDLRSAVRAAVLGGTFFSPPVARALAERSAASRDTPTADALSQREREVLSGIARGLTNKEIAAELGIGRRTVESHRENLMDKLGIRTVAGLTKFAMESGVVQL
ncbi:MAG: response regulator transcription factor [Gemmatimonadaceae bacterium]|nr:response regulator transcription factor [Gemmatimonadaceae bacterium]